MNKKKIIYLGVVLVFIILLCIFLLFKSVIRIAVGGVKEVSYIIGDNDYTIDGDCALKYDKKIIGVNKGKCNIVTNGKKRQIFVRDGDMEEVVLIVGDTYEIFDNDNIKDFVALDNSYISYSDGIITGLRAGNVKAVVISLDDDVYVFDVIIKDVNTSNTIIMDYEEFTDDMKAMLKNLGNGYAIGGIWDGNNTLANNDFYRNSNTLKEYFKYIKKSGFDSVKIPISVYNYIDSNYNIKASWLNTINSVVDAAISANLYVIIGLSTTDSNNDNYCVSDKNRCYINANINDYSNSSKYVVAVWKQIAEKLKGKGNHLLFEGFDSIINSMEKDIHNPICNNNNMNDSCAVVNRLNADFVNTVRGTGGNNVNRFLICSTYDASITVNSNGGVGPVKAFVVPDEDESVIMGVKVFDKSITTKYLKENFVDKMIPVLISSYGIKYNKVDGVKRVKAILDYNNKFVSNSIPNFLWDNGKDNKIMININRANSSNDLKSAWDYNYGLISLLNTKMEIE